MAWSWSHSNEAYHNARENLFELSMTAMIEILAEWKAHNTTDSEGCTENFNDRVYRKEQKRLQKRYRRTIALEGYVFGFREELVNAVWGRMEEQSTCDNGGFNAWCCPYGCHTVSFSAQQEETVN